MKKIIFIICFCFVFILKGFTQQDPQYTQYMYNQNVVNPAYVTNDLGVINFGVMHRRQWTSAVGTPKTYNFFVHAPLSNNIEAGLSIVTDDIGDGVLKENNFYADFAYMINVSEGHKLSFGLKAGFTSFNTNFNGFRFPDEDITTGFIPNDLAFENQNKTFVNFGAGLFYFTDKYYIGAAIPNLVKGEHFEENNGLNSIGGEEIHLFVNGGYVFHVSDLLKLKPSFMAKAVKGSPLVVDTAVNVLFDDKFEAGLAYRVNDAISVMFNIRVLDSFRFGYAFDYTTTNLGSFNSGTHEFMLLFDFDTLGLKKGYDKSPRFF
ncbi:type IX secretion system membrane protein PorP/SprF [uncultured Tenacibaculum sp.]|uniref:PorP/SprF family type IX secretion system membrane protein n=1 Tax=uncultured Tenacibaculum sp. TaxID=174713 RepID=UPI00261D6BE6|nr:type IX secretion system membrane protein PorP/SprF [uncultured Tenacibaculum sp.]